MMSSSAPGASAEDDAERATRLKPRGRLDDGVAAHRSDAKPRTRGVGRGASPRSTRAAAATRGRGSDATERARAAARSVDIVSERVGAPISTVEARLDRALGLLRWRLERSHGDDDKARARALLWAAYFRRLGGGQAAAPGV